MTCVKDGELSYLNHSRFHTFSIIGGIIPNFPNPAIIWDAKPAAMSIKSHPVIVKNLLKFNFMVVLYNRADIIAAINNPINEPNNKLSSFKALKNRAVSIPSLVTAANAKIDIPHTWLFDNASSIFA